MSKFRHPVVTLVVVAIAVLWTIPTFGLLVTSLRPRWAEFGSGWWTVFIEPNLTLDNYEAVLTGGSYLPEGITPFLFNSLAIAIPATFFPITLAAMAAYALMWIPIRGATFFLMAIITLQIVPIQMALLPLLELVSAGPPFVRGSYATLWIAHTIFALPIATYLMFVFGSRIPKELIEAARVDGANHMYIFRKIFVQLTVPAIASIAIFQFIWVWNDLLIAITFVGGGSQVAPITAYLSYLNGGFGENEHLLTAGTFIAILIPLAIFFGLQRYFVRGLTAGAVNS